MAAPDYFLFIVQVRRIFYGCPVRRTSRSCSLRLVALGQENFMARVLLLVAYRLQLKAVHGASPSDIRLFIID